MYSQNLKEFAELIKNFKSAYGAGGIQNKARPGGWREDLAGFFVKNNKEFNDPYKDNSKIFNSSMMGFKEDGSVYTLDELQDIDEDKEAILLAQTEKNDFYFIANSDIIIFYLDESAGFGTYTEFRENYDKYKKPMIIVRNIARKKLPHWIKPRRYNAIVKDKTAIEFKTLTEMKEFFKEYLGFKL